MQIVKTKKPNPFFEILNDISFGKKMLLHEDNQSSYSPFIINDIFSRYIDSLAHAEEMNRRPNIPKEMQYRFMMNSMSKRKRFSKMPKFKKPHGFDEIREYYKYNNTRTQGVFDILSPEQIDELIKRVDKGGVKK